MDENKRLVSAVDFYFIEEDGKRFKATMAFEPYFYIRVKKVCAMQVSTHALGRGWKEGVGEGRSLGE